MTYLKRRRSIRREGGRGRIRRKTETKLPTSLAIDSNYIRRLKAGNNKPINRWLIGSFTTVEEGCGEFGGNAGGLGDLFAACKGGNCNYFKSF